ncbi:hypothetical protein G1C95_0652 [Bifidobacterium sp. DSM 109957]|uniref:Uncharacterized protein n=1 Tax=Bifidobacterium oedipodis TaxID=2675322 RepID=A0A7Y0HSW2_9BIFI|nr:hypothetical protein [Bifidobacterium sp. DSM 109957]
MKRYLPRCRTCGSLSAPSDVDSAYETAKAHMKNKPGHAVGVIPIRVNGGKRQ